MSSSSTDNNMLNISAAKNNFSVSFFWLRDHCRCERCYDFSTHQRIFNFLDIPIDIKPTEHSIDDGNKLNVICKSSFISHIYIILVKECM